MQKRIVVRKNEQQRIGVSILMLIFIGLLCIIVLLLPNSEKGLLSLILFPIFLVCIELLIYYQSWQIVFEKKEIYKKVFFVKHKIYSYSQISDIVKEQSYTEYTHIRITFSDKKMLVFRLSDENANVAIKILCSYHSIRIK